MSQNKPVKPSDVVVGAAVTIPSSKAVSQVAKKVGVEASIAALNDVTSKAGAKLDTIANGNNQVKNAKASPQVDVKNDGPKLGR